MKGFKKFKKWVVGRTITAAEYDNDIHVLALSFDDNTIIIISTELFVKGVKNAPR